MSAVFLRAFSFLFIIFVGIFLRSSGIVPEDAGNTVKKLLVNLTLPAAIITNFSKIESLRGELLFLVVLGLCMNIVMISLGVMLTKRRERGIQALYILCLPAVNIGAFCLPFIENFMTSLGIVAACIFDVGNSIMCTGVTYAFAKEYVSEETSGRGIDLLSFGKRLLKSVPLDCYVGMFLLTVLGLRLPDAVISFISPMANANAFVAMLMIGLLFHLELKPSYVKTIVTVISLRVLFAAFCAAAFYFLLPFQTEVRQALALISFGPVSAVAPAYVGDCGGDEGMASCINSISIFVSLFLMTAMVGVLGLR